jgi:heptose I phosphotransferase
MKIKIDIQDEGRLKINSAYADLLKLNGITSGQELWDMAGTPVKKILKERGTEKVVLKDAEGNEFDAYIKRYLPVGFKERIKCAFSLKRSSYDANNEWDAICAFHSHDWGTMVPLAVAALPEGKTCNLTLGITDYIRASEWFDSIGREDVARRRRLIAKLANLAGEMHANGFAHQDFYLVHFFIKPDLDDKVFLIDLQRVIKQENLNLRWLIKDLGQLLFSAKGCATKHDIYFFWKIYLQHCPVAQNKRFIKAVLRKADKINKRDELKRIKKGK